MFGSAVDSEYEYNNQGNYNVLSCPETLEINVMDHNSDLLAEVSNRLQQHNYMLSSTLFKSKSRESDYSALDFLCDMCIEVEASQIVSGGSFEKFADDISADFVSIGESPASSRPSSLRLFTAANQESPCFSKQPSMKFFDSPSSSRPTSQRHQQQMLASTIFQSKSRDSDYSALDFLCDTCIEVEESSQFASGGSMEKFVDDMEFTLQATDYNSSDEESNYGKNNEIDRSENPGPDPYAKESLNTNQIGCENDTDKSNAMTVNVNGVDMLVRIVQIGNSCYLEPIGNVADLTANYAKSATTIATSSSSTSSFQLPSNTNTNNTNSDIKNNSSNCMETSSQDGTPRQVDNLNLSLSGYSSDSSQFGTTGSNNTGATGSVLSSLPSYNNSSNNTNNNNLHALSSSLSTLSLPPTQFKTELGINSQSNIFNQNYNNSQLQTQLQTQSNINNIMSNPVIFPSNSVMDIPYFPNSGGGGFIGQQQNISGLAGLSASQMSSAGNRSSAVSMNPKHIYRTACDTYRVQVGKGSKGNPNGKFSRNVRSELDAIWLCEIALLFIDCPPSLKEMICNGNYKCLLHRQLVSNPSDYLSKLTMQAEQMRARGFLKESEWQRATTALVDIMAASSSSSHMIQGMTNTTTIPRLVFPTEMNCSTGTTNDLAAFIGTRKKRRRHNVSEQDHTMNMALLTRP
eukprot:gene7471-15289_t